MVYYIHTVVKNHKGWMRMTKAKYWIWDKGCLVPAYVRKPKNPDAVWLGIRTTEEARLGIRYYAPVK